MAPRTEQQFEEIRQEKSMLIMETALNLFATNGFKSTTISQIAHEANISKGLLYNYFESKESLLESILTDGLTVMFSKLDLNNDGILESHEMEYFLRETVKLVKENKKFWKLYWSIIFEPTAFKLIEKKIEEIMGYFMQMVTNYFKVQGYQKPEIEAMIFGAIIDGFMLDYVLNPDMYPIDDVVDEIVERYCKPNTQKND